MRMRSAAAAIVLVLTACTSADRPPTVYPLTLSWRATSLPAAGGAHHVLDLAACDGRWYAVGAVEVNARLRAAAWTSGDGLAWSEVSLAGEVPDRLTAVACRGAELLATAGVRLWSGRPGGAWAELAVPAAMFDRAEVHRIVAGPAGWLLLGQREYDGMARAAVWFSADGVRFRAAHDAGLRGAGEIRKRVYDAAPDPATGWIMVGSSGPELVPAAAAWRSADGLDWRLVSIEQAFDSASAARRVMPFHRGGVIVVGGQGPRLSSWLAEEGGDGLAQLGAGCAPTATPAGETAGSTVLAGVTTARGATAIASAGSGEGTVMCASTEGVTWYGIKPPVRARDGDRLLAVGAGRSLLVAIASLVGTGLWLTDAGAVDLRPGSAG